VTRAAKGFVPVLLVLLVVASCAQGAAAATGPLSASPDPAALDEGGRAAVTIVNETARPLRVRLAVVGPDGRPIAGATAGGPPGGVLAGGAAFETAISEPSGPVASRLVVVAAPAVGLPLGAVLRVGLQPSPAVAPAVSAWTVRNTEPGAADGRDLPLTGRCGRLGLTGATKVGTVQGDGIAVPVTATCASAKDTTVRLEPGDAPAGHAYAGKVQIGGKDVELTVTSTVAAWVVAVVLGVSILIALALAVWQGWLRDAMGLRARIETARWLIDPTNENGAELQFQAAARELDLPPSVREWTIRAAIAKDLGAWARKARPLAGTSAEERAKIRADLDRLELEVRQWPEVANRLGALRAATTTLRHLTAYVETISGRTLGRTGPVDRSDMADIRSAAEEALGLAVGWPVDAIATAQLIAAQQPDLPAAGELKTILERFAAAADPAGAKEAANAFWEVYRALRAQAADRVRLEGARGLPAAAERPARAFAPAAVTDPLTRARAIRARIWLVDGLVLAFLLAVAFVAGMKALWVGHEFGGFWDFASAVGWGVGATAVLVPVTAALGDLRMSWAARRTMPDR